MNASQSRDLELRGSRGCTRRKSREVALLQGAYGSCRMVAPLILWFLICKKISGKRKKVNNDK